MAPTALALPPLAVRLPDAEPSRDDLADYWQFIELAKDGHEDWAMQHDYSRILALYLAAGTPFSVQFFPGMEVETPDDWGFL